MEFYDGLSLSQRKELLEKFFLHFNRIKVKSDFKKKQPTFKNKNGCSALSPFGTGNVIEWKDREL